MLDPIEFYNDGGNSSTFSLSRGASNSVLIFPDLIDKVST